MSSFIPLNTEAAQQQEIQNKKQEVQSNIDDKKKEISQLDVKSKEMEATITKINSKVKETTRNIETTTNEIKQAKQEMGTLKEKIKLTKHSIQERKKLLKNRARSIQLNDGGSMNYITAVVEAESLGDLFDRVVAVSTFVQADRNILQEHKKDQETLEKSEQALNQKLAEIQKSLAKLEELKEQLNYQIADKNSLLASLKEQQENAKGELGSLEDQKAALAQQEKEAQVQQEKERIAAQKLVKAVENNNTNVNNNTSNGNESNSTANNNATNSTTNHTSNPPSSEVVYQGSNSVEVAIQVGSSIVGRSPYKWGGGRTNRDIQNRLFDCSSFVRWAYASAGVNLGSITGTNTDSLVRRGRAVSASQMKRGDLIFFNTYKTNGHVGIYLGNGKFLNDNTSHGVSIDSLSNRYWKGTFTGVVRRVVE